jgi:hypothetical protein
MSKNDITGANLQTKAATDNYRSGWDLIYANKKSNEDSAKAETEQPVAELETEITSDIDSATDN